LETKNRGGEGGFNGFVLAGHGLKSNGKKDRKKKKGFLVSTTKRGRELLWRGGVFVVKGNGGRVKKTSRRREKARGPAGKESTRTRL